MSDCLAQTDAGSLLQQQRSITPPLPSPSSQLQPEVTTLPTQGAVTLPNNGGAAVVVSRFVVVGNMLVSDAALQTVLRPWVGTTASLSDLHQATLAVEQHYRAAGWLVSATLPKQDVTQGEIQITVTEARTGSITIDPVNAERTLLPGERARMQALLARQIPADQALNLFALERALVLLNESPAWQASGSLRASQQPGRTDVVIQLTPTKAYVGELSLDNSGGRSTGQERLTLQLTLNSPFGLDEQVSGAASTTRGTDFVRAGFIMPVGLQGWRIGANASALRYRVLDSANITTGSPPQGSSQTLGLDAQYPVFKSAQSSALLIFGLEEKHLHNLDDSLILGQIDTVNRARLRNLNIGLAGWHVDSLGGGGVNAGTATFTDGQLALNGSPNSYVTSDQQLARTQGHFHKLRWSVSRSQSLTPKLSLFGSWAGQWADKNLESAEKFYLGGMSGVRAYPSGEVGGSKGNLLALELRAQVSAQWLLTSFYDWGRVSLYQDNSRIDGLPLVANNSAALRGPGISADWRAANKMSVKGTWARRLGSNPLMTPAGTDTDGSLHKNRFWLQANVRF